MKKQSQPQFTDNELKLARSEMNSFLTIGNNEVIEFLQSYKVENPNGSERVLNAILDKLIIDFKEKYCV